MLNVSQTTSFSRNLRLPASRTIALRYRPTLNSRVCVHVGYLMFDESRHWDTPAWPLLCVQRRPLLGCAENLGNDFKATAADGFGQDRAAMRAKQNFGGFIGITQEDAVISMSQGPIYDRTTEHFVANDMPIVKLRQRLQEVVRMTESGMPPLGVAIEDMTHMCGFDVFLEPELQKAVLVPRIASLGIEPQ